METLDPDSAARLADQSAAADPAGPVPRQPGARPFEGTPGRCYVIELSLRVGPSSSVGVIEWPNCRPPRALDATCLCDAFQLHGVCVHILTLSVVAHHCLPLIESVVRTYLTAEYGASRDARCTALSRIARLDPVRGARFSDDEPVSFRRSGALPRPHG
jgi:hypothetical protein